MAGSTFSIIGADVTITGNISASADLHIDGRVDGDISCAALVQGEGGHITGAITAENARLAGKVAGSVSGGALTILKTAHIDGDVHYDTITIEQGAQVEGRLAQRGASAHKATPTLMLADAAIAG